MRDVEHVNKSVEHNNVWLPWLTTELRKLGLTVTPSVANFVLIHFSETGAFTAGRVNDALKQRGIYVRQVSAYGLENALRMTVGTGDENKAVIAALNEILSASGRGAAAE